MRLCTHPCLSIRARKLQREGAERNDQPLSDRTLRQPRREVAFRANEEGKRTSPSSVIRRVLSMCITSSTRSRRPAALLSSASTVT
jgi:hypothetical protein